MFQSVLRVNVLGQEASLPALSHCDLTRSMSLSQGTLDDLVFSVWTP